MVAGREIAAFVCLFGCALLLCAARDKDASCAGAFDCILEMVGEWEYRRRCLISLPVACMIYLGLAYPAHLMFPRVVAGRGARPPVFCWWRLDGDVNWSLVGVLAGTPYIQLFHYASEKFGSASGMRLYKDPLEHGLGWALLQIPIYLLMWDLAFYLIHRFVLHAPKLYPWLHSGHHTFRPPTAWSGIAVGPIDVIFEGIPSEEPMNPIPRMTPTHTHTS